MHLPKGERTAHGTGYCASDWLQNRQAPPRLFGCCLQTAVMAQGSRAQSSSTKSKGLHKAALALPAVADSSRCRHHIICHQQV